MTTDKTAATLATAKHGGCVQLGDPRSHRWDDVGERCLDCGDKDWMGGACSGPRATAVAGPWLSITNAPSDGQQHIRGLWVTSRIDGEPDTREWRQYIGLVNDGGEFVDPEYGETFGWEADEYEAWMPAPEAPGAALSTQPSPGGQDVRELLAAEFDKNEVTAAAARRLRNHNETAAEAAAMRVIAARQPVCATCDGSRVDPGGKPACRDCVGARQPVGEPITIEAVATVRRNGDGDRYIDWLTEGGIADLEVGDVLMVSDRAITDEDGSGEVYTAPPGCAE